MGPPRAPQINLGLEMSWASSLMLCGGMGAKNPPEPGCGCTHRCSRARKRVPGSLRALCRGGWGRIQAPGEATQLLHPLVVDAGWSPAPVTPSVPQFAHWGRLGTPGATSWVSQPRHPELPGAPRVPHRAPGSGAARRKRFPFWGQSPGFGDNAVPGAGPLLCARCNQGPAFHAGLQRPAQNHEGSVSRRLIEAPLHPGRNPSLITPKPTSGNNYAARSCQEELVPSPRGHPTLRQLPAASSRGKKKYI